MSEAVSTPEGASMRDALGAIYDQMQGGQYENDPGREEPETPEAVDEVETSETPEEVAEVEEVSEVEETEGLSAPEHWASDRKELFSQVSPEVQQAWLDRETEYERGIQQKSQEAASYRQAIEPIRSHLQLRGMDETTWIRQMAAYTTALEQNPLQVIQAVAQQYGVDLSGLNQDQDSDEFVDPQVRTMKEQIDALKRQIDESQQTAQQQQASAQTQAIQSFRDEKDASGNPAHPHFDAVLEDIMVLAQGYRTSGKPMPTLPEIYERALRLHPELVDQQKAQAASLEKAQKAKRARSAAASARSTVAESDQPKPQSLKDELRLAWDKLEKGAN